jgi:hypothetical protein
MTVAWRIDSIDARAGAAFGSWRDADLSSGRLEADTASIYFAPPYFLPEAVTSRGIGFGAARGSAQLGVFVYGEELAFATLEALAEFVRRAYLTSGGGDLPGGGAAGGGPRTPPLAPERGGLDLAGLGSPAEDLDGAWNVVGVASQVRETASRLTFRTGTPVSPASFDGNAEAAAKQGGSGDLGGGTLVRGAEELVLALLGRFPLNGRPLDIVPWGESSLRLSNAISRLHLWRSIMEGPNRSVLDAGAQQIGRALNIPSDHPYLLPLIMQGGSPIWPLHLPWEFLIFPVTWGNYRGVDTDPLDDLAAWPLPPEVRPLVGSSEPDPSAFHLMSAICGAPAKLLGSGDGFLAGRTAAILLFCAARILAENAEPFGVAWGSGTLREASLGRVTTTSLQWLMGQWPTQVFPLQIEEIIAEAAALPAGS